MSASFCFLINTRFQCVLFTVHSLTANGRVIKLLNCTSQRIALPLALIHSRSQRFYQLLTFQDAHPGKFNYCGNGNCKTKSSTIFGATKFHLLQHDAVKSIETSNFSCHEMILTKDLKRWRTLDC